MRIARRITAMAAIGIHVWTISDAFTPYQPPPQQPARGDSPSSRPEGINSKCAQRKRNSNIWSDMQPSKTQNHSFMMACRHKIGWALTSDCCMPCWAPVMSYDHLNCRPQAPASCALRACVGGTHCGRCALWLHGCVNCVRVSKSISPYNNRKLPYDYK